jgi:hypothetical protein
VLDWNKQARHAVVYKGNLRIGYFGCSGGRTDFESYIRASFGMVRQWRNIGGVHEVEEWDSLQSSVKEFALAALAEKQQVLFITSSHGVDGVKELGCKGHEFDTAKAKANAESLKKALDGFFEDCPNIFTIRIHMETDEESLVLYNDAGEALFLQECDPGISEDAMHGKLTQLYRNPEHARQMPHAMLEALLGPVMENIRHIASLRETDHRAMLDHREWILAVGGGFDWLYRQSNTTISIGLHDPNLYRELALAARIMGVTVKRSDFVEKRGMVTVVSVPYTPDPYGIGQRIAAARAAKLAPRVRGIVLDAAPELKKYFQLLVVTVNVETWELDILTIENDGIRL